MPPTSHHDIGDAMLGVEDGKIGIEADANHALSMQSEVLSRVLAARQHDTQTTLEDEVGSPQDRTSKRDESSFLGQIRSFFFLE